LNLQTHFLDTSTVAFYKASSKWIDRNILFTIGFVKIINSAKQRMTTQNAHTSSDSDADSSLARRRVVVTGAAHGLGLAIARRFAADGAYVVLVDCDDAVLSRVSEKEFVAGRCFAIVKDLSDLDAASVVFDQATNSVGVVDTLINNAAWSFHKPMLEVTGPEFERVVNINQRAPFFLAQQFFQRISVSSTRSPDPVIINISSVNALAGNPNLVAYAGTKGAMTAMTRAMAVEMQEFGIRVNAIVPSAIRTYVTENLIAAGKIDPSTLFEKYLIKRFASCEEIAELVAYLCSPAATYVNGATWAIDGGYLAV
jgi:NAD(P)-dependent dehydrogenase (short-subunit alcohol dehydrogenase family)